MTGMPPPPPAITRVSFSISVLMLLISMIFLGSGEATTRRYPRPASYTKVYPFSIAIFSDVSLS